MPSTRGAARRAGRPGIALTVIVTCQLMVVLDSTIVNIANPHIKDALNFSTSGLSWVINAYTLTFGGLLLLGGRAGDILGRRRVFVAGISLFTLASLAAGLAQEPWQLLAARAVQGIGGAIASTTSLALITTTFPEGPARTKAFGVYAAVSGGGGAIGLLAGGVLVQWLDWRWIFFVNLPIGLAVALLAPLYIDESPRHSSRFDLLGALTSTLGMSSLVYGFIRAADDGWRDGWTIGAFVAAVVLLALFVVQEHRTSDPITPLSLFADRNRAGSYAIMLALGGCLLGLIFFLVIYVQNVLGYSAIKTGIGFLPVTGAIGVAATLAQKLLPRFGPKPFLIVGTAVTTVSMVWFTRIAPDSSYVTGVMGPMIVFGLGLGLTFVTLTLTAVSGIAQQQAGAASGLLNAMQGVGGALGLSILVTVFGSASRSEGRKQVADFMATGTPRQKADFAKSGNLPTKWADAVLTHGVTTAYLAGVVIIGVAFLISLFVIKVRKSDLAALSGDGMPAGL
ncbi:drug resistance transporter, EmrB/QacA subfamily [Actinacidiphila paucisporea]|uniref:Drug resistance transporter, EmrB/QacA subfamily n=1 Tax=Actinacidiphila paucisporea TaxID=310782 RepID=A0A1M7G861_9ACTN|nr:drug resistance transporter, EmrB/QacA subfamily [Actinacidiphila paucisporea]